jgi:hypothetical protein
VYGRISAGNANWNSLSAPEGLLYPWDTTSTYIKHPPFFQGMIVIPTPTVGAIIEGLFLILLCFVFVVAGNRFINLAPRVILAFILTSQSGDDVINLHLPPTISIIQIAWVMLSRKFPISLQKFIVARSVGVADLCLEAGTVPSRTI